MCARCCEGSGSVVTPGRFWNNCTRLLLAARFTASLKNGAVMVLNSRFFMKTISAAGRLMEFGSSEIAIISGQFTMERSRESVILVDTRSIIWKYALKVSLASVPKCSTLILAPHTPTTCCFYIRKSQNCLLSSSWRWKWRIRKNLSRSSPLALRPKPRIFWVPFGLLSLSKSVQPKLSNLEKDFVP